MSRSCLLIALVFVLTGCARPTSTNLSPVATDQATLDEVFRAAQARDQRARQEEATYFKQNLRPH